MDKKHKIIFFWSSEDNAFVAEVPELPGCMADGKTYQEALGNAEQIIEDWIETATKLGRPNPQPKGPLRMPDQRCWLHNNGVKVAWLHPLV